MTSERDDDDEIVRFGPPLPPDDRLWRHPSELGSSSPTRSAQRPHRPVRRGTLWAVGLLASISGAALMAGVLAATGSLDQPPAHHTTEKVALTPVVSWPLVADDQSVAALSDHVGPSVVRLEVITPQGTTVASGVVYRDDGLVLTSASPLDGSLTLEVVLADGRRLTGELVGIDIATDIAVVDVAGIELPVAVLGNATDLEAGSPIVALGAAEGLEGEPTVSTGVVRSLRRRLDVAGQTLHGLIEVDAPVDASAAGGPLLDRAGAVIGIITGLVDPERPMGHATPIDLARQVADHLVEHGTMAHAWLGIESRDHEPGADATGTDQGAAVRAVADGSPAETGGLLAGDVIVELGRAPVTSSSDLVVALREHRPGDEVGLTYWRAGERRQTTVICGER